jgi:hypothetical protein
MCANQVLVVNGRKINSYALTLEAANYYKKLNYEVSYLDLNIYQNFFSRLTRLRNSILKNNDIEIIKVKNKLILTLNSAFLAMQWYLCAIRQSDPWKFSLNNSKLEIGRLVRSLIARTMGTGNFTLKECSKIQVFDIVLKLYVSYFRTLIAIDNNSSPIDLGIAHGGRDSFSAGAVSALRERNIKVRLVESGGIVSNWTNFETSPHYSPDFWSRLKNVDLAKPSRKIEIIEAWWSDRIRGSDHFRGEEWSHSRNPGELPLNLPCEFISFFTTSDFEIPVFNDFEIVPGKYKNQFDALEELYRLANEKGIHIVVRRHPNSVDWKGQDREAKLWEKFIQIPNLTYIGPNEKIDSIELARRSSQVFTFKSSVGIEAIWLGVPSFALGPARWSWLEELRVWDEDKLNKVLLSKPQVSKDHAIRWATMMIEMDNPNDLFVSISGNCAQFSKRNIHILRIDNVVERVLIQMLFSLQYIKTKLIKIT